MNRKVSFDAVVRFCKQLTDDELRALVAHPQEVKQFLAGLLVADKEATFVEPISDKDLSEPLQAIAAKYRKLAAELGYTGPVAWQVREGFTLKRHAPKAGPCYQKLYAILPNK